MCKYKFLKSQIFSGEKKVTCYSIFVFVFVFVNGNLLPEQSVVVGGVILYGTCCLSEWNIKLVSVINSTIFFWSKIRKTILVLTNSLYLLWVVWSNDCDLPTLIHIYWEHDAPILLGSSVEVLIWRWSRTTISLAFFIP